MQRTTLPSSHKDIPSGDTMITRFDLTWNSSRSDFPPLPNDQEPPVPENVGEEEDTDLRPGGPLEWRTIAVEFARTRRSNEFERAKDWTFRAWNFAFHSGLMIAFQLHVNLADTHLFDDPQSVHAYVWSTIKLSGSILTYGAVMVWTYVTLKQPPPSTDELIAMENEEERLKALRSRAWWMLLIPPLWNVFTFFFILYGIWPVLVNFPEAVYQQGHTEVMIWSVVLWSITAIQYFLFILLVSGVLILTYYMRRADNQQARPGTTGLTEDDWQTLIDKHSLTFAEYVAERRRGFAPSVAKVDDNTPANSVLEAGSRVFGQSIMPRRSISASMSLDDHGEAKNTKSQRGSNTPRGLDTGDDEGLPGMLIRALSSIGSALTALSEMDPPVLESQEEADLCPICMLHYEEDDECIIQLPCFEDHLVHGECLKPWLDNHGTCPICRADLSVYLNDIGKTGDQGDTSPTSPPSSPQNREYRRARLRPWSRGRRDPPTPESPHPSVISPINAASIRDSLEDLQGNRHPSI